MKIFEKARKTILKNASTGGFPIITTSLLSFGVGFAILGKHSEGEYGGVLGYFSRAKEKFLRFIIEDNEPVPLIPIQSQEKPVLMFDCDGLLFRRRFSPFRLDFLTLKRVFSDVFLFHAAHLYELISISDSRTESNRQALKAIDPYGCISYKVYCDNKKKFSAKHLNRPLEKVIVISTKNGEYHEDFADNTLIISEWCGWVDRSLFDLTNFLYNLYFANVKDFRNTIRSYSGKEFYSTFEKIQEKIFTQRNMFSWDVRGKYRRRIDEVNRKRIEDFQRTKEIMDLNMKKETPERWSVPVMEFIFRFILKAIL